jgi:hypothetical protein
MTLELLHEGWGHLWRLGSTSVLGTFQRTRGAWALASVLGTPCAHVALRYCSVLGTPCTHMVLGLLPGGWAHSLHIRGPWAMPQCWAHPTTHVALGLVPRLWAHPCAHVALSYCLSAAHMWRLGSCLCAGHTSFHTWRFGCLLGCWIHPSAHVALGYAKT